MTQLRVIAAPNFLPAADVTFVVAKVIANAGDQAARRFLEFFAATIRNKNTRQAYDRACCHTSTVVGLRDQALISVMTFAFACVGAVVAMRVEDYHPQGKRWWLRLHEKGGKRHEMPAHHNLEAYLDAYIEAAGIQEEGKSPLFRSFIRRTGMLTANPMHRVDAYRMIQRRAADLGTRGKIGCHTFRATGITAYLEAGGTLENAQAMAAHESPRTTKLYDRTGDEITLDEVERITI